MIVVAVVVSGLFYLVSYDWSSPWWRWILKPLTTLLIMGVAIAGLPWVRGLTVQLDAGPKHYAGLMLLGLGLSLMGDVFLMLPGDRFIPGLASFLGAHIAYAAAFWERSPGMPFWGWLVALGLAGVGVTLYRRFRPALRHRAQRRAVALYVVAILVMSLRGLLTGSLLIGLGALLFLLSDAILGWNRFVRPVRFSQVWIMTTYWVAQVLLALSVLHG